MVEARPQALADGEDKNQAVAPIFAWPPNRGF